MKNFKKLIKEAYLGNPLNEELGGEPQYYVKYTTQDGETAKSGLMSKEKALEKEKDLVNKSNIKKAEIWKTQKRYDLNYKPYTIEDKLEPEEYGISEDKKKESKGDKEIEALEKKAEKYSKGDSRREVIQKDIGDLKFQKYNAQPGSKAYKKFFDEESDDEVRVNEYGSYGSNWEKKLSQKAVHVDDDVYKKNKTQLQAAVKAYNKAESEGDIRGMELAAAAFKMLSGKSVNEESLNDRAKKYFLQKVSQGEIDTLPENPKEEFLAQMMKDQMDHDEETLRRERGDLSKSSSLIGRQGTRNFMDESEARINEIVKGDDFRFIDIKDLHFETDPDRLEDMKIEFGAKMGGVTNREMIEDAEYELRRFRKEIGFGDGSYSGVFLPGSYDAINSKLGDGPYAKKVPTPKWNERKYEQWIEDVASGGGAEFAYDMAQNAKMEAGLIDWVKKNRLGFGDVTPLERIQYDIEALAESLNEAKMSKERLEDLIWSLENEIKVWHPSSDSKKKAMIDKLKKKLSKFESVNEVTQKEIDDIENSGNIDMAYKKAMKLLNSLKDTDGDDITIDPDTEFKVDLKHLVQKHKIEDVNEIVSRLPVEELTDEALTRLRDQFLTTGTRPNAAEMDLLKSVLDEMGKRGLEESINEGTCGYTPDGKPRSKPAGPYLNEDDIDLNVTDDNKGEESKALDSEVNHMFEEDLAENTTNWSPAISQNKKDKKYYVVAIEKEKIQAIDNRGVDKTQLCKLGKEKINKRFENLEKDLAENLIKEFRINEFDNPMSIDDLDKFCAINESKEFNFNKMIKEALTPNYLK
ncbi:MAG: hypothetical protein CMC82_10290 [Flavobacteriaceae bacterium]|nr:hypothetical protein [Flavobacteriaceae bacterium]|tara:strand:+ start:79 stop:2496 length:2418 start_codon:yes stop_codon:yes gene_type:complete